MCKKTVGVVFGGKSSEHEISLISARSIIENIPADKYNVVKIGITRDGEWRLYEGDTEKLPSGEWESCCTPAVITPDASVHGLTVFRDGGIETVRLDAVFPALHGKNGEDGSIQGLFQLAGIPYVGCGVASSAICMDKALTNIICDANGIAQARWLQIEKSQLEKGISDTLDRAEEYLRYPVFVKPARAGSSVGISKAYDRGELEAAVENAFRYDSKIVCEEFIDGFEVECAVMGNVTPTVSSVGEIVPESDFYDYDAKYRSGTTKLLIPSSLTEEKMGEVRTIAAKAYKAFGCTGLARIDFLVDKKSGKVFLNEPNTLPGFTSISMYPKLFEADGVAYGELLDRLIEMAFERDGE